MSTKLGVRGQVIHSQSREIIYNVYKYLRGDSNKTLKELKEAVAAATGVSVRSVANIIQEGKNFLYFSSNLLLIVKITPIRR